MSIERSSTAGSSWPGKTLERFSRRIMVSAVCLFCSSVALSVTDTPRSREFAQQVEERVEQQRKHDDGEHGAEHQVQGRGAADAGEPGEEILTQPGTAYDGANRRDAHEEHSGHAHPGDASGSSMRSSRCRAFIPIPCADSTIAGSTERSPATVFRSMGKSAYITSPTTTGV